MKRGNLYKYFMVGSTWDKSYTDTLADWEGQLERWIKHYGNDAVTEYTRKQIEALKSLDADARAYIDWYAEETR